MRIITDELLNQAKDMGNGLDRDERSAIFNDRMLEDKAMNAKYSDGQRVKDAIDSMLARGGVPSFKRSDKLGRAYAKMAQKRNEKE